MLSPTLSFSRRSGAASVTTRSSSVWPSTIARPSPRTSTIEADLAARREAGALDDVERLVQHDQLAFLEAATRRRSGATFTRIALPSTMISAVPSLLLRVKIP